jgi:hypothetical protein
MSDFESGAFNRALPPLRIVKLTICRDLLQLSNSPFRTESTDGRSITGNGTVHRSDAQEQSGA